MTTEMSNTRHANLHPSGDMGIGLCYNCTMQLAAGQRKTMPDFGVVYAPIPVPLPNGQVMAVAVPACFGCISSASQESVKRPLLVANGRL